MHIYFQMYIFVYFHYLFVYIFIYILNVEWEFFAHYYLFFYKKHFNLFILI